MCFLWTTTKPKASTHHCTEKEKYLFKEVVAKQHEFVAVLLISAVLSELTVSCSHSQVFFSGS